MARPLSPQKRQAIIDAAIRLIAMDGVGTTTASIAKTAGVAEGTLFTYFKTKDVLLNELFLLLKREVTRSILAGYADAADRRAKLLHVWRAYITWGVQNQERRRTLRQLEFSHRITEQSMADTDGSLASIADVVAQSIGNPERMSVSYARAAMVALADATIDMIADQPDQHEVLIDDGGQALMRLLGAP